MVRADVHAKMLTKQTRWIFKVEGLIEYLRNQHDAKFAELQEKGLRVLQGDKTCIDEANEIRAFLAVTSKELEDAKAELERATKQLQALKTRIQSFEKQPLQASVKSDELDATTLIIESAKEAVKEAKKEPEYRGPIGLKLPIRTNIEVVRDTYFPRTKPSPYPPIDRTPLPEEKKEGSN